MWKRKLPTSLAERTGVRWRRKQIESMAASLQKVSAQIEMSRPAPNCGEPSMQADPRRALPRSKLVTHYRVGGSPLAIAETAMMWRCLFA